jgi:type II secretory pathway component PulF
MRAALKNISFSSSRFTLKDQVSFAKRLSFLMGAGITLVEGLSMLKEQGKSRGQKKVLSSVLNDIMAGQSLSRSFGRFPKTFGDFTISIVKVGENSGTLSTSLTYLAEELKKKQILRRKMISAFIYPALITAATLGITAFLMLYLFPKIMPVFASLHTTLPLSTRVVMAVSVFFQHWWLQSFMFVILTAVVVIVLMKRSRFFHERVDTLLLGLPVVGSVMQYYNIANGTRTLGLLLKSGLRLSEGIAITAETTKNLVYKRRWTELAEVVNRGERMSAYFAKHRAVFPDMIGHMVAVGERSGSLSETLTYLSDLYEHEVDEFTKNLSTLIEPALMIVMGVVVGFIAISIITPIYGITQNLHS